MVQPIFSRTYLVITPLQILLSFPLLHRRPCRRRHPLAQNIPVFSVAADWWWIRFTSAPLRVRVSAAAGSEHQYNNLYIVLI